MFTRFAERVGLWKMPSAGGEPTLILDENAICPAVSPDGKTVAFVLRRAGETNRIAGRILGTAVQIVELSDVSHLDSLLRAIKDVDSVYDTSRVLPGAASQ